MCRSQEDVEHPELLPGKPGGGRPGHGRTQLHPLLPLHERRVRPAHYTVKKG